MNKISISVLMPIYNVSKYLDSSLGGLLQQSLQDIEVICVNDGSTDNSLEIIKKYAEKDSRIIIIDKENGGYGHTMNKALEIAKGEYIGILEPDDFMDTSMYQELYAIAKKYDADVVKSNYYEYQEQSNTDRFLEVLKGLPYNTVVNPKENHRVLHMRPCIWSSIYRKDIILSNGIRFTETPGASYQDTGFAFKVWVSSQKVVFVKEAYLHYRVDNANSSVKSSGKVFNICDEFNSIQAYLNARQELRNEFSKVLQVLKLDTYTWNLKRISDEYKEIFKDQIALDFIKAEYDGFLDRAYFDNNRWNLLQSYLHDYKFSRISNNGGKTLLKIAMQRLKNKLLK